MGTDIGNRVGEKIWPFLFKQGRRLAAGLCRFINDLGFLPFLHFADDHPVSRNDLQRINRRVLRQGEHIDAFNKSVRRVFKALGDNGAGRRARYRHIEIRGEPRRFKIFPAFRRFEQQASGLHIVGGHKGELCFARPRLAKDRQRKHESQSKNCNDDIKTGFEIPGA
jgi:hypothetical protein